MSQDEARVKKILDHYEGQTEADAVAEDTAALAVSSAIFPPAVLEKMRQRGREAERRRRKSGNNHYLKSQAKVVMPSKGGWELWLVESPMRSMIGLESLQPGHCNGYVYCPKRSPQVPRLNHPLLDFIPVHGGITYQLRDYTGKVFGFDTGHFNSHEAIPKEPRAEAAWYYDELRTLDMGLRLVYELQKEWHRATKAGKAKLAQCVFELSGPKPVLALGMGGLMKLLSGKID